MYAVIETGGKQYRVELGTELAVERLDAPAGGSVTLDRVLLVADGDEATIGRPLVADAVVSADVVAQDRADKVIVFKYRPKARRRVKKGHRQDRTVLRISDIRFNGRSAAEDSQRAEQERKTERERLQEAAARQAAEDAALAAKLADRSAPAAEPAKPGRTRAKSAETTQQASKTGSKAAASKAKTDAKTDAKTSGTAKTTTRSAGTKASSKSTATGSGTSESGRPARQPRTKKDE
ncbi:MAG TPA: 50S ribosomal protein L21 [Candidatus Limnocylindrales bacterium]